MLADSKFPIYCESLSGLSFYHIESDTIMTEYQLIGSRYAVHQLSATILPERVLLADMISNAGGIYPRISAEDYRSRVENCERTRQRIA